MLVAVEREADRGMSGSHWDLLEVASAGDPECDGRVANLFDVQTGVPGAAAAPWRARQ
jgi:hypothetical protein